MAFLTGADAAALLVAALRLIHVAAVFVALVLMFRPRASGLFRRSGAR